VRHSTESTCNTGYRLFGASLAVHKARSNVEEMLKLSIEAELVYNFVGDTQVIANLEASRTSDQVILSESLDIQPPA
jgi:hypothetical protein